MTAKQKADDIYNLFDMIIYTDQDHHHQVLRCSIRCVEQILFELPEEILETYKGESNFIYNERFSFFKSVKMELEKL